MHWFHPNNKQGSGELPEERGPYPGEDRLLADIDVFKTALLRNTINGNEQLSLTWALHPAGFPASQPVDPDTDTEWCDFASELFQAGKVVRLMLLGRSQDAEIVSWHTHMAGLVNINAVDAGGWELYSAMGLRQDTAQGDPDNFRAHLDAWRRSSWYAFRCLSAMLARTHSMELAADGRGLFVLRLSSRSGFTTDMGRGGFSSPVAKKYHYAYICWLDQTATDSTRSYMIAGVTDFEYTRFSLAPAVDHPLGATDSGDCGYATGETVDWEWSRTTYGWTTVADLSTAGNFLGTEFFVISVKRSATYAPVPACFLSNHGTEPIVYPDLMTDEWGVDYFGPLFETDTLVFDVGRFLELVERWPVVDRLRWTDAPMAISPTRDLSGLTAARWR